MSDRPFPGWPRPGYTQVPNLFFDEVMPTLTLAETRVLLYIIRRTIGFQRDATAISIAQIRTGLKATNGRQLDRGTGLGRTAVTDALRSLIEKQMIVAQQNESEEFGTRPTTYALRFDDRGSAPADAPFRAGDLRPSAPADLFPIEERKTGERKGVMVNEKEHEAAALWAAALEQLRGRGILASNVDRLKELRVSLEGAALVIHGPADLAAKWTDYLRVMLGRPVRFTSG